jgi:nucleoside 2-deoxyribosyltransferase
MHAYIAGSMFNEAEQWWLAQIDDRVRKAGLTTYLNQRDGLPLNTPEDVQRIYQEDVDQVTRADVVVASLNGVDVDGGTAWELGLAYARGKHIVGVNTDWRHPFKFQAVNLMIEGGLDYLARSLDDLEWHLREHLRTTEEKA